MHREEINLIFVGRIGWIENEFIDEFKNHPDYGKRLFHIDGATNGEVKYLYEHAFLVAFPTHMEGFGLPIVEALNSGCVVLTSDIDVLREAGEDYCVYFAENDEKDFAVKTKELLQSKPTYNKMREKVKSYVPYSWDEAVVRTLSIICSYCHSKERLSS